MLYSTCCAFLEWQKALGIGMDEVSQLKALENFVSCCDFKIIKY